MERTSKGNGTRSLPLSNGAMKSFTEWGRQGFQPSLSLEHEPIETRRWMKRSGALRPSEPAASLGAGNSGTTKKPECYPASLTHVTPRTNSNCFDGVNIPDRLFRACHQLWGQPDALLDFEANRFYARFRKIRALDDRDADDLFHLAASLRNRSETPSMARPWW